MLDRAVDTMAVIGFTALVLIAFMTLADVMLRYLNGPRVPGLKDITEVAFAVVVSSCFPAGLRKGNAVTVNLLGKALGPRWHASLDVIGATAMLALFSLFCWQLTALTLRYQAADRTTSTVEWPVAPVWWVVSLLMAVCVVVQATVTWDAIRAARAGRPRPAHNETTIQ